MIECQYCYTRNNDEAPTCQACGGPLVGYQETEEPPKGLILLYGITEEQWQEARKQYRLGLSDEEFMSETTERAFGLSVEDAADALSQMMRMI